MQRIVGNNPSLALTSNAQRPACAPSGLPFACAIHSACLKGQQNQQTTNYSGCSPLRLSRGQGQPKAAPMLPAFAALVHPCTSRSPLWGPGGVKRIKTKARWTFVPLNGLATDGEPWTCKREQGKRSAASHASVVGTKDVPSADPLRQPLVRGSPPRCLGGAKTAGQNGFGDFCRNKSHPRTGPAPRSA